MAFDRNEVQAYIRDAARRRGIDPNTALRVIKQESGFNPMATNLSPKEKSYGLMQLNTQGGLGVHALEKGINIRDPNTWRQQVDFGLDVVAKDGWRQWYGARDVGIGRWDGIGGRPANSSALVSALADRQAPSGAAAAVTAMGEGENVASSTNGPAATGMDLGGQPTTGAGNGMAGPTVNIGLKPERSTKLYDAMLERALASGAKSQNPWDVVGSLAQVWAASSEKKEAEAENASELQKALANAGLDPSYALAAQLSGGRDGAASAILAQQQDRTQAANRAQAREDMLEQRAYQQNQDAMANDRAERGVVLQEEAAARKGDGFRMLTPEEVSQRGLPPGSYQVGADGKIDEVGKGGQTINVNGQSNKFREKADERMVKRFGDIADGQTAAANTAQTIPVMRELLTQAPTGPLAGRLAERFPGFSTAGDAFKATVNQIAPTLRIPGSGAMSDRDMDVLMGSFPKLSNDPNANGLIMGLFEKKAQLNLQRADIANKALRGEIDAAAADQQLAELDRMPLLDDAMRATLTGQPQPQQPMSGGVPVGGLVPGSDAGRTEAAPVRRARNPQTGQILELRNGQWVPAQ